MIGGRFRDGRQRSGVCRALLAPVSRSAFWGPEGPRLEAHASPSFETEPDVRRLLSVCWTIWSGADTVSLAELLELRPDRLRAVGELMQAVAAGPDAIDGWLEEQRRSHWPQSGVEVRDPRAESSR